MDSDTFCRSGELVNGVSEEVFEFLFLNNQDFDRYDLINSCDSAIQEIESWKKAITQFHGLQSKEVSNG